MERGQERSVCKPNPFIGALGIQEPVMHSHSHFGISSLSHPVNALEVCGLLTPLHIVPEWYFLCQYAMLKAVPNKNAGFIILLTSIFTFFFFGEIRNLTTFTRLMDYNNGFSLSSFFLSLLSFPNIIIDVKG